MFNAKQLLDQLVQATQGAAVAPSSGTSSLQQNAGLGGLLSNPAITGALGMGGGLLSGMLLNSNKTGMVGGGGVASHLGAAALGGFALNAFNKWQAKKKLSQTSSGQNSMQQQLQLQPSKETALNFDAMPEVKQEEHSRAMLSAIIAAAKADGHFDEREKKLIREATENLNDPDAVAWVQQEINKPLDISYVAGLADSPEMAAEIYFTSLVFIGEQNEPEKKYLESLAEELKLDPQLKIEIEQQVSL